MISITIDSYRCSGCGTCCVMCPDVFTLNPLTGKAELIDPDQRPDEAIRQAAAFCPEKCILIEEEGDIP
ncbi:ferredoxin [Desulfobulbus propionicus]